ncbi:ThuA domain-containing protein, partial [Candidatus Poribacteria bacterium]|nr:ThuA domain-containing protein [Candidatus Poribacteria bacterium]
METKSLNALILSGGVAHPYAETSQQLKQILEQVGTQSFITEDLGIFGTPKMEDFDIVVLNCVWWTCDQTPNWRDAWHRELPEASRVGLLNHLRAGKGLLALHAATICFDDWPEWRKILGAWWEWGISGHAPYQEHRMKLRAYQNPIIVGLADFSIIDELYTYPQITDTVDPLI